MLNKHDTARMILRLQTLQEVNRDIQDDLDVLFLMVFEEADWVGSPEVVSLRKGIDKHREQFTGTLEKAIAVLQELLVEPYAQ